eukprot:TRINITY_DN7215_c0_g2_i1.p1 TRINITY_DN7215_c0_g2~~TRINITY_DN7215_c0_g2_i1.p1  ORF type:complete len:552 (+),score=91.54 TRINITY_DN7215_c0_g2_i1:55-1710(+)
MKSGSIDMKKKAKSDIKDDVNSGRHSPPVRQISLSDLLLHNRSGDPLLDDKEKYWKILNDSQGFKMISSDILQMSEKNTDENDSPASSPKKKPNMSPFKSFFPSKKKKPSKDSEHNTSNISHSNKEFHTPKLHKSQSIDVHSPSSSANQLKLSKSHSLASTAHSSHLRSLEPRRSYKTLKWQDVPELPLIEWEATCPKRARYQIHADPKISSGTWSKSFNNEAFYTHIECPLPPNATHMDSSEDIMKNSIGLNEAEISIQPNLVYARSTNNYPPIPDHPQKLLLADPICDYNATSVIGNRIVSIIADGCGWGFAPALAARRACRSFAEYLSSPRTQRKIHTLQDAARLLVRALAYSHSSILAAQPELLSVGTTTVLGGMLVQLKRGVSSVGKTCWIFGSVGDCKSFLYNGSQKTMIDLTVGNRVVDDVQDPGGRLGPHRAQEGSSEPDLRNMCIYYVVLGSKDAVFLQSDGVYDNFDPQLRGISPTQANIKDNITNKWNDSAHISQIHKCKSLWMGESLRAEIEKSHYHGSGLHDSSDKGKEKITNVIIIM